MTEHEESKFESELQQFRPAKLPEDFLIHLRNVGPPPTALPPVRSPRPTFTLLDFFRVLRWAVPSLAVVLVAALLVWRGSTPSTPTGAEQEAQPSSTAAIRPVLKADDVQIGEELVSSFDTVARLPGGEPVRFRVQQWMDEVVVSDKSRGLVVESRTPRLEVVAVGFDTY